MSLQLRRRFWEKLPEETEKTVRDKLMYAMLRSPLAAAQKRRVEQLFNVLMNPLLDAEVKVGHLDATIGEFAANMEPKDDPWALELLAWWQDRYRTLWKGKELAMALMEEEFRLERTGRMLVPLLKERRKLNYMAESRMIGPGLVVLYAGMGKEEHIPNWAALTQIYSPPADAKSAAPGSPVR